MRQIRSADPWSTFLAPTGRGSGAPPPRRDEVGTGPARSRERDAAPDPSDAVRRVIDQLGAAHGPQTLEEIRHGTGLGSLEVADAVETLRDRGLVTIEREIDDVVRLTGGGRPG